MRRVLLLLPLVVLAACSGETNPATNVTHNGAQLNATASCKADLSGEYHWQIRQGAGNWTNVGANVDFDCPPDQDPNTDGYQWGQNPVPITAQATGLAPSSAYTFRLEATLSNGSVVHTDADGTTNGTNYDGFTTAAPPQPPGCNLNATPANFAAQVSAATAGQTVCLANGNYGIWTGTNKAITVKNAVGATPTMRFSFGTGDSGFTLDGMGGMGGGVSGGANNITVKRSAFTGEVSVNGTANGSNLLFDSNTHNNISGAVTANRFFASGGGLTIQNSRFEGGGSDGVRLANSQQVRVLNNTFLNVNDDGSGNHTDMIQWYGGANAIVRGNLFKQTFQAETQVMGAFDGTAGNVIEDNVVDVLSRPWAIELYSDTNSIVRHNTLVYRAGCFFNLPCGQIDITRKSVDDPGVGTQVYDNVATSVNVGGGSTLARRDHNMLRSSAGAGDFIGVPVYVGGANPSSYAGYRLAAGSPGKAAASDGLDVGIR